jgi:hypothetical protein
LLASRRTWAGGEAWVGSVPSIASRLRDHEAFARAATRSAGGPTLPHFGGFASRSAPRCNMRRLDHAPVSVSYPKLPTDESAELGAHAPLPSGLQDPTSRRHKHTHRIRTLPIHSDLPAAGRRREQQGHEKPKIRTTESTEIAEEGEGWETGERSRRRPIRNRFSVLCVLRDLCGSFSYSRGMRAAAIRRGPGTLVGEPPVPHGRRVPEHWWASHQCHPAAARRGPQGTPRRPSGG